jgi:hypothetical protein
MMVGGHELQTFEVVLVVLFPLSLLCDVFVLISAHPLLYLDKRFVQIHLNASFVEFLFLYIKSSHLRSLLSVE